MSRTVHLGNDEFILYIRKNHPNCNKRNDVLGKSIWIWLEQHDPTAIKTVEDRPSEWGSEGNFVDEFRLPKTATQFRFSINTLPDLYKFLDELAVQ